MTSLMVSCEEEPCSDDISHELRDVSDKITAEEKKLQSVTKNLAYLYGTDKGYQGYEDCESDEEWSVCERQILSYGDTLATLEKASQDHEALVTSLKEQLENVTTEHRDMKQALTNNLLDLKVSLLNKNDRKKFTQQELERGIKRQEMLEQTVVRLRTLHLMSSTLSSEDTPPVSALEELSLREEHEATSLQASRARQLLAHQSEEQRRIHETRVQAAAQKSALDFQIRTLMSDRDMARLEFADVCREYRVEKENNKNLRARVEDAHVNLMLESLGPRHKETIWNVISLDTANKRASQRCEELHKTLDQQQDSSRISKLSNDFIHH